MSSSVYLTRYKVYIEEFSVLSIRSHLWTRASQRENVRRSACVAPARPAASSLKAGNGETAMAGVHEAEQRLRGKTGETL
jgi:hypothetical protein